MNTEETVKAEGAQGAEEDELTWIQTTLTATFIVGLVLLVTFLMMMIFDPGELPWNKRERLANLFVKTSEKLAQPGADYTASPGRREGKVMSVLTGSGAREAGDPIVVGCTFSGSGEIRIVARYTKLGTRSPSRWTVEKDITKAVGNLEYCKPFEDGAKTAFDYAVTSGFWKAAPDFRYDGS